MKITWSGLKLAARDILKAIKWIIVLMTGVALAWAIFSVFAWLTVWYPLIAWGIGIIVFIGLTTLCMRWPSDLVAIYKDKRR